MMRNSIFDLENGGRLIHEVDLYTSKYGTGISRNIPERGRMTPEWTRMVPECTGTSRNDGGIKWNGQEWYRNIPERGRMTPEWTRMVPECTGTSRNDTGIY